MNELQQVQIEFDYAALEVTERESLKTLANETRFYMSRTVEAAYEAGKRLIKAQEILRHNKSGGFAGWLKLEFGLTRRSAYRFINLANNPNCDKLSQLDMSRSVIYLLAAPSTPESAREEAIERAESGEKITHKEAKAIKEAHLAAEKAKEAQEAAERDAAEILHSQPAI